MNAIVKQRFEKKTLILAMLLLAIGCWADHSDEKGLAGIYEGMFAHGNFSTPIQIEIKKDSLDYKVYFTSPDQNAYGIPTSQVKKMGDSISFELNSDYFSFRFGSKLSEDGSALNSILLVDSIAQNFTLKRMDDLEDPTHGQEEVSFNSEGFNLKGTVYHPSKPSNKAIYFVTSSGNSDRSATRAEAIAFTDKGYVAFHMDKRGTGTSEGDWGSSSIEDLAMDDINAIKFLATKLEIPFENIGIKGSSQGGAKVPYILSKMKDLAFGIVVSCPSTTLLESDLNYWKNRNSSLIEDHYFDEALAFERGVFQFIGGTTSLETLKGLIAQNSGKPWFTKVWVPELDKVTIDTKLQYSPMPYFKIID
ncbi:alpha/beta hydrolase family protein [Flagellimonas aequoris]|uniref:Prolyl oligopeptidase family serine peptidase n=1 Tax=Flagellimonas aequoris TaxID=2306997 RepID=A0A418N8L6_9FLAO|nr:alpha/beta hydrolase [Allomuricauda aequoris]RIV71951.1 hypothetical protein D2U88_05700 [Allomuricauda aequoris]TXK03719.1 prolyl oligopeptidase family serine peptidase [Allomuricauda aequoris]